MVTTFAKFRAQCRDVPKFQRPGQWAFNHLDSIRPELATPLRGSRFDPFSVDERLGVFFDFLEIVWKWPLEALRIDELARRQGVDR